MGEGRVVGKVEKRLREVQESRGEVEERIMGGRKQWER